MLQSKRESNAPRCRTPIQSLIEISRQSPKTKLSVSGFFFIYTVFFLQVVCLCLQMRLIITSIEHYNFLVFVKRARPLIEKGCFIVSDRGLFDDLPLFVG